MQEKARKRDTNRAEERREERKRWMQMDEERRNGRMKGVGEGCSPWAHDRPI
jgi:hypothetical protein